MPRIAAPTQVPQLVQQVAILSKRVHAAEKQLGHIASFLTTLAAGQVPAAGQLAEIAAVLATITPVPSPMATPVNSRSSSISSDSSFEAI